MLRRIHAREQQLGQAIDPFYRVWQFNRGVAAAARRGDLEVIKWLTAEYAPGQLVTDGVESAAQGGHLYVIKWLHDEHRRVVFGMKEMWVAAKNGHLEVFQWLHEHASPTPAAIFDAVVQERVGRHIDSVFGCYAPVKDVLFTSADAGGHLRMVHWLVGEIDKWMRAQQKKEGACHDTVIFS